MEPLLHLPYLSSMWPAAQSQPVPFVKDVEGREERRPVLSLLVLLGLPRRRRWREGQGPGMVPIALVLEAKVQSLCEAYGQEGRQRAFECGTVDFQGW